MIDDAKLDFWIENDFNVAFRGKHGTGKTSTIIEAFKRNNLKWLYFSAPTLDPWVDFLGVPREKTDDNGNVYLDFVLPKALADGTVEAIFLDEYNRSHKKIRNAVMELIQFKSINGKKFPNLKIVWTAINPSQSEDITYDVEELDPAQLDRFHVIVDVDSSPSKEYFVKVYGENGKVAVDWWNSLAKEASNVQDTISPRRLEYALQMYLKGGDIKDVLGSCVNTTTLTNQLKNGSFSKRLITLFKNKDDAETAKQLQMENFFPYVYNEIIQSDEYFNYFVKFFPSEKFNKELLANKTFRDKILSSEDMVKHFAPSIREIITSDIGKRDILKELRSIIRKYGLAADKSFEMTDFLDKYYVNASVNLKQHDERIYALDFIKGLNYSDYNEKQLNELAVINAIIGAKTFGRFYDDTVEIFQNLGYLPQTNDIGSVLEKDYISKLNIIKNDKIFTHVLSSSIEEETRYNNRIDAILKQYGILPQS